MEFLDIGEKLKTTRKQLKMKQAALVDDNITRAFISMIEIGKRTPSKYAAQVIIAKLRTKAKELGIKLDIDDLYLSRSAKDDAEIYCTQKLEYINLAGDIKDIIKVGEKYKLDSILALAYKHLGNTEFSDKNYIESFTDYINALGYYSNLDVTEEHPYLYNMMGRCKVNQIQFLEALTYYTFAEHYSLIQNNYVIRKKAIYNIAVCNKKLGRIKECISYIDIHLSLCDKDEDFTVYIYSNVLKSTCYEADNLFNESIELLKGLLKEFNDVSNPLLGLIYNNLGIIYLKKRMFDRSIEYFDISEKIITSVDKDNLSHTVVEKAFVYIEQGLYDLAINQLKYGMDLATESNDTAYQLKSCYTLADIYVYLKNNEEAETICLKLLNLLEINKPDNYRDEFVKVCTKLCNIYLKQGNMDKIKNNLLLIENIYIK